MQTPCSTVARVTNQWPSGKARGIPSTKGFHQNYGIRLVREDSNPDSGSSKKNAEKVAGEIMI